MASPLTPSQTVGPFFHPGLLRDDTAKNVVAGEGERSRIEGRVLDGDGEPVTDAMLEIWQADPHGRYRHPDAEADERPADDGFVGFGRAGTDEAGRFWFETMKPGRVPHPDGGEQAPHLLVHVFARGLLDHLVTRIYFADEPSNADDPVLVTVPEERRGTLVADRVEDDGAAVYRFDVVLQGPGETVFFEV